MDNVLNQLDNLQITGDACQERLWSSYIDLIHKTYVPEYDEETVRPSKDDFNNFKAVAEKNLRKVRSMMNQMIRNRNDTNMPTNFHSPILKRLATDLLLLVGEHNEKSIWNTEECVSISMEIITSFLSFYGYENTSQYLMDQDNWITLLSTLRPKLLKDTWLRYPAAVSCYKWIIQQVQEPSLYTHINIVLPTALIIIDDFVPEYVVLGLECLHLIVQHSRMKKGLVETGYGEMILHALERVIREREHRHVPLAFSCMSNVISTLEYWDSNLNVFGWTQRDNALAILLDNMEFQQDVQLRRAYMQNLRQFLTNIACVKWGERLTRILSEYCEQYTDLTTLKATLETAKAFLMLFQLRIAPHCVPLYTAFIKLHFDLTETPVFDNEIMQNLEDCIHLLYRLSPNVGSAVMNDDRMRLVIKNSLRMICLNDTKYFE